MYFKVVVSNWLVMPGSLCHIYLFHCVHLSIFEWFETERHRDGKTKGPKDKETESQRDRKTKRWKDKETKRQIEEKEDNRQRDK